MSNKYLILPEFSPEEKTPLVESLLLIIQTQFQDIQELRQEVCALKDEIATLKNQKPRPPMLPGKLEKPKSSNGQKDCSTKRPGSEKRSITKDLKIHETKIIKAYDVPAGSTRNGYQNFVIRDIVIKPYNTRLRLERWLTPGGQYVVAQLPKEYKNGHIGPMLKRFILTLYHSSTCVTQPALKQLLDDMDIDVSKGQIANILTDSPDLEIFHNEKDAILEIGIQTAEYLTTDETSWRHKAKNYFCNYIGNMLFSWFGTASTKSRIQFLTFLALGKPKYLINEKALLYIKDHGAPEILINRMNLEIGKIFDDKKNWDEFLTQEVSLTDYQYRIVTEGAMIAGLLNKGFPESLVILSDDAGQFNVFLHALCWVHAERPLRKLIPINDEMRIEIDKIRDQIWSYYESLKIYKEQQTDEAKIALSKEFDRIFTQETLYIAINKIINSIYKNKSELLVVLDRPEIPLHNNSSEQAMHGPVKKRKVSGGSKSDSGLKCRDTFASLKDTCRKLGISFWDYLLDRLLETEIIPSLASIIRERATACSSP